MAFDRIGPYGLNLSDHLAASLLISFRIGSRWMRLCCFATLLGAMAVVVASLWYHFYAMAALAIFWLGCVFALRPALRSIKNKSDVYLSYDPMGIRLDSPRYQTIVKWPTITRVVRVGTRLFLMINGKAGLVITERSTSESNMDAIEATLNEHT